MAGVLGGEQQDRSGLPGGEAAPVHGISQTRLRSNRERKLRPRTMRSSQHSGTSPDGSPPRPLKTGGVAHADSL